MWGRSWLAGPAGAGGPGPGSGPVLRHPTGGVFAQENKGIAALRKVAGIRSNAEGVQGRVLVDMT